MEQQRLELLPPSPRRRTGRAYRRMKKKQSFHRMYKIVTQNCVPHVGFVAWDWVDGKPTYTGKHIKHRKNSNCQRWCKQETSTRVRKCMALPRKGNAYRRLFDYWGTLY